jgi:hypothetical protein
MMRLTPFEIEFAAEKKYANPYTDVELYVVFTDGDNGHTVRRPAFWDGGDVWRVRFAAPVVSERWTWRSVCSDASDAGLHDRQGEVAPATVPVASQAGLLRMSLERRTVVRADGSPLLLVGDTAWSLPWRGTPEGVTAYAKNRQRKGFNCTLLMTVQPDQRAEGPRDRLAVGGFDVGFQDLPTGHINELNSAYFRYMDRLMGILLDHGIVPVYQPVFQGYGWKGLGALGSAVDPQEYARYCRYLVARYCAEPAIWLVSADGDGLAPCVAAGGEEIHTWDDYHQPLGIHYSPSDSEHRNRSHQETEWLDFQWCQTGHDGTDTNKVSEMATTLPTKGVANGEPTYEGIGDPTRATGWWQGNEAWKNLTYGGTMGVFYGTPALWKWKVTPDEPGWPDWATDYCSWEQALDLPGSTYVGHVSRALEGFDYTDMTRHPELAGGRRCAANPGAFYCVYLPEGGDVTLTRLTGPLPYVWFDPKEGAIHEGGTTGTARRFAASAPTEEPWVLLVGEKQQR